MAWRVEVSPAARGDLNLIFDHLQTAFGDFGYSPDESASRAETRLRQIVAGLRRLALAPQRGTRHALPGRSLRHVTIDRAVYWFTLNEAAETVYVEGIFHGGQDHFGRMIQRLTQDPGPA